MHDSMEHAFWHAPYYSLTILMRLEHPDLPFHPRLSNILIDLSVKIDIVSLVTEINVLGPLGMSGANRADKLSASTMDSSLGPFRMFKETFPVD